MILPQARIVESKSPSMLTASPEKRMGGRHNSATPGRHSIGSTAKKQQPSAFKEISSPIEGLDEEKKKLTHIFR